MTDLNKGWWTHVDNELPPNSEAVLITDGSQLATANFFAECFNSRTGTTFYNSWGNSRMVVGSHIKESSITHWMPMSRLYKALKVSYLQPAGK